MVVHTDPAKNFDPPIPYVEADAELIKLIWGKAVITAYGASAQAFWQPQHSSAFPFWCFACHGGETQSQPIETYLLLDAEQDIRLDTASVLAAKQQPRVIVLGACVAGRIKENFEGEPLGLVSAFFLRGADYVVAPVQPVYDFYMPLFTCLFHQAWQHLGRPDWALAEAKRRLLAKEWYHDSAQLLEQAYRPVLMQCGYSETAINEDLDKLAYHPKNLPDEPLLIMTECIRGFGQYREVCLTSH